jgi:hypothetical protein
VEDDEEDDGRARDGPSRDIVRSQTIMNKKLGRL